MEHKETIHSEDRLNGRKSLVPPPKRGADGIKSAFEVEVRIREAPFRRPGVSNNRLPHLQRKPQSDRPLGGGTAIALRIAHRLSDDIDIFVPSQPLKAFTPNNNPGSRAISNQFQWPGHYLRFECREGEIDFLSPQLQTDPGFTWERYRNREVALETLEEVIVKKIRYRSARFTARDVFDLAVVARAAPAIVEVLASEVADALPRLKSVIEASPLSKDLFRSELAQRKNSRTWSSRRMTAQFESSTPLSRLDVQRISLEDQEARPPLERAPKPKIGRDGRRVARSVGGPGPVRRLQAARRLRHWSLHCGRAGDGPRPDQASVKRRFCRSLRRSACTALRRGSGHRRGTPGRSWSTAARRRRSCPREP